jgi:tetratricopeptide (TPR) repeat protein
VSLRFPRPEEPTDRFSAAFVRREAAETAARIAQGVESPWIVPIHAAIPVIYGAPLTASRPSVPIPLADAATCALQVCDVLARLHAAGWVGLGSDAQDIRVLWEGGAWRASVLVPHLPPLGRTAYADLWYDERDPVNRDLRSVVAFLRDLLDGHVPEPIGYWGAGREYAGRPLAALPSSVDATLRGMLAVPDPNNLLFVPPPAPEDAVALGQLLAPLSHDPDGWRARLAALSRARPRALRRDWDRLVALGERELRERPGDAYVTLPFARALHQRACRSFAAGDLNAAERDLERCLAVDPWYRYRVTRASFLEARGDLAGALAELDDVIRSLRRPEVEHKEEDLGNPLRGWVNLDWDGGFSAAREASRALYARGVIRYRRGDLDSARADLDEAVAVDSMCSFCHPNRTPSDLGVRHHQALATVLRAQVARGDTAARPLLVKVLLACGRDDEARALAAVLLADHPDDATLRRRFSRWFPGLAD